MMTRKYEMRQPAVRNDHNLFLLDLLHDRDKNHAGVVKGQVCG